MDSSSLKFQDLANLRLFLRDILSRQVVSLKVYYDGASGGFHHRHDKPKPGDPSKASSATCVLSLIATGEWNEGPWKGGGGNLVEVLLLNEWKSAGLQENNAFTMGFVFEAVSEILRADSTIQLGADARRRLNEAREILLTGAASGALDVEGYPPSAYVTQLVVRALKKDGQFVSVDGKKIAEWAEQEINKQIALLAGDDKTADVFQLAYSTILLANLVDSDKLTPDQEFLVEAALKVLFQRQRSDGTWPLSRPLFHYPNLGSAYCFDYEMLVQLLSETRLTEKLLPFIPKLAVSARALKSSFQLGDSGAGWSSGHHPQLRGPESWSTASVYHFVYAFERLVAEQIRQTTFADLGSPYDRISRPATYDSRLLRTEFLDCCVELDGKPRSLKKVISGSVIAPLVRAESQKVVESGKRLPEDAPVSIILFGPPGTSKTKLASIMARRLGWPLLPIDASQFLGRGMDGVYAEADRILGMFAVAERILVLLDEFDEMVRARETATDVLSRFLTTAMLPKLIKINENHRLVFVVATNHIEAFDLAIRRPGRFDVILQVMPPTARQKIRRWPDLLSLQDAGVSLSTLKERLQPLTYSETESLVRKLKSARTGEDKRELLQSVHDKCTLLSVINPEERLPKTWKDACDEQRHFSRVL